MLLPTYTNSGTFDIQEVSVIEEEDSIIVVCHFASGTDAQGFVVDIHRDHSGTVLTRNVSLIQCGRKISNSSQPCVLETSFYKQELLMFGNYTLSVYNWENDDSLNKVFSKQLKVITSTTAATVGTTVTKTESNSPIVTGKHLPLLLHTCSIRLVKFKEHCNASCLHACTFSIIIMID